MQTLSPAHTEQDNHMTAPDTYPTLDTLDLWVAGDPKPQGSKRHVGHGRMIEANKELPHWRNTIIQAIGGLPPTQRAAIPIAGPVCLTVDFVMPRPTRTPKKATPPAVKKPDLDKLLRAILDALTLANAYTDDSQVTSITTHKTLAQPDTQPGAHIQAHPA